MPTLTADGRRVNGKRSGAWITALRRLAIYLRDGFLCAYCGRDLSGASPRDISLDHITPRCRGGSNESRNLITACLACNSGRQDTPVTRYATPGALARIRRNVRREPPVALARAVRAGTVPRDVAIAEAAR